METQESSSNSNYKKIRNENDDSNHSWYILSLISWITLLCIIWYYCFYQTNLWELFENQIIKASGLGTAITNYYYFPIKLDNPWLNLYICLISL